MARKKPAAPTTEDDLLGDAPTPPAAKKAATKAAKPVVLDDNNLMSPAVNAVPLRIQSDAAVYNRAKSDPFPGVEAEKRWCLTIRGVAQFFTDRKECFRMYKAHLRGGAPAKRGGVKRTVTAADPAAPVTSSDPDVGRASEQPEGIPVPSVWRTDESAMGLLVHVRNGVAKMVSLLGGDYGVSKVPLDRLFSTQDNAKADYRHHAAEWAKGNRDKDYPTQPGDRWWATTASPRKFCDVAFKSSQPKSVAALAFMQRIASAGSAPVPTDDDLLGLGSAAEEDLLA